MCSCSCELSQLLPIYGVAIIDKYTTPDQHTCTNTKRRGN